MSTTTFATPEIPFADFADYSPGHGTETVRDTVLGLRDEYSATRIKTVTTPVGHLFIVTGPVADIARLAALYGQRTDGTSLPTDEHREHMRTVETTRLGQWLSDGMYGAATPLWAAAMDELHARARDEEIDRRWGPRDA